MFILAWPFVTFVFWYVFFNYFRSSAYNGRKPLSDRQIFMLSCGVGGFVSFFLIGFWLQTAAKNIALSAIMSRSENKKGDD